MQQPIRRSKRIEWLKRYVPAELLGTLTALLAAGLSYNHSHSFILATATGWAGEGIGFYGYFVVTEFIMAHRRHINLPFLRRLGHALSSASSNLLIEFLPAELLDTFFLRPFLLFLIPHLIHPYLFGFLIGKFAADAAFYGLAICGYEIKKRWFMKK